MKSLTKQFSFNRRQIKWIATLSMLLDHLTIILEPTINDMSYIIGRGIGRVAFPLYALLFVDSFFFTSSRKNYLRNLILFALISEIPYDLTFQNSWLDFSNQNILFLFVAMSLLLMLADKLNLQTTSINFWILMLIGGIITTILNIEYSIFGIVYMSLITHIRTQDIPPLETIFYLIFGVLFQAPFSLIAVPLIFFYNQNEPTHFSKSEKYFFYFFYPTHILFLYIVKALMLA